ncbi:MAG TPA: hypothetical protein VII61_05525 [Ktedonobacteraceae bacterium]
MSDFYKETFSLVNYHLWLSQTYHSHDHSHHDLLTNWFNALSNVGGVLGRVMLLINN